MADYVNTNLAAREWADRPVERWSIDPLFPTLAPVVRLSPEEVEYAARVGALIASTRLAQDMSQEALAEAVGVGVSTLGRWERGENAPKTFQAAKVISALRIDPMVFLNPPDQRSDLDRLIEQRVGAGMRAAYRPRRRATRRADGGPDEPRAPRRPGGH